MSSHLFVCHNWKAAFVAGSPATTCFASGASRTARLALFEREPHAVLTDVLEGLVSVEAAQQTYGVVIEPTAMRIDDAATLIVRAGRTGSSKA